MPAATATAPSGGAVLVHPVEVPGVGRLAVLADAGGAVFSILRNAGGDAPDPGPPRPGQFAWHQLECPARRRRRRGRFLRGGAGLEPIATGRGGEAPRSVFRAGRAGPCAEPRALPGGGRGSRWLGYLAVDDLPGRPPARRSAWAARCWCEHCPSAIGPPAPSSPTTWARCSAWWRSSARFSCARSASSAACCSSVSATSTVSAGRSQPSATGAPPPDGELQVLHRGDLVLVHLGPVVARRAPACRRHSAGTGVRAACATGAAGGRARPCRRSPPAGSSPARPSSPSTAL